MAYNNQKLVYAASFGALKTAHPNWANQSDSIYKAVVFTADGYVVTHGTAIKGVVDSTTGNLKVNIADGKLTVIHGTDEATVQLPVHQIKGINNVIAVNDVNGVVTIGLQDLQVEATSGTPTSTSVTVSQVTVDTYGRTTSVVNKTFDLDKVTIENKTSGHLVTGEVGTGRLGTSNISVTGSNLSTTGQITAGTLVVDSVNVASTLSSHGTSISALEAEDTKINNAINANKTDIASVRTDLTTHINTAATSAVLGNVKLSDSITQGTNSAADGIAATPKAVYEAVEAAKKHANDLMSANDALVFAGTVDTTLNVITPATGMNFKTGDALANITVKVGYVFKVSSASRRRSGSVINGKAVELGDMIIAVNASATDLDSKYNVIQGNIDGAVITSKTFTDGTLVITKTGREIETLANGSTGQILVMTATGPQWKDQISVVGSDNITVTHTGDVYTIATEAYKAGEGVSINDHTVKINKASVDALGGIKIGSGEKTPVKLDSSGAAYVDVDLSTVQFTGTTNEIVVSGLNIGLANKTVEQQTGDAVSVNGRFNVVESVTTDEKGRVEAVKTKQVTIKDTTYNIANSTDAGLIKADVKVQRTGENRDYAVFVDSTGKAWVNVPWADTDTQYYSGIGITVDGHIINLNKSTADVIGGVKVVNANATTTKPGSNNNYNGGSYELKTTEAGLAFVDVPWVNTWRDITINSTSIESDTLKFSDAFTTTTDGGVDLAWYEIK
jgi:hypothetical protein